MSSVNVVREEVVVYAITLPSDPEPIVLRVPAAVAQDLWQELELIFLNTSVPEPDFNVDSSGDAPGLPGHYA